MAQSHVEKARIDAELVKIRKKFEALRDKRFAGPWAHMLSVGSALVGDLRESGSPDRDDSKTGTASEVVGPRHSRKEPPTGDTKST